MKKIVSFIMAFIMFVSFNVNMYATDVVFSDVNPDDWFYQDVKAAVNMKLINGKSNAIYAPYDSLTYAEAIKLAACMHQLYNEGFISFQSGNPWYQPYVDYCMANKIINREYNFDDISTRAGYMTIFANALPDEALKQINLIPDNSIPDVYFSSSYASAVYKLYRAGIVTGVDSEHNCNPYSDVTRAEVAAILTRMMNTDMRIKFSIEGKTSYMAGRADKEFLEKVQMNMEAGENGYITKEVFEPNLLLGSYNFDTMNVFKEAFKYTNVKPKAAVAANEDASLALDSMLAYGTNLSDIVVSSIAKINDAALEGAFVPLDTLIDRFAPNIKAYFEKNPNIKAQATAPDGRLYVIPSVYESIATEGFYIRTDWLDKLGLEVPKTVDEYHEVLLAFKNGDPNGNGIADEIPFFQRHKDYTRLAQLWDAYPGNYVDENGKVCIGKIEPEWKGAMQGLAQWNKEGLIDPELSERPLAREVLLSGNLGGSTHDWFSSTGALVESVKAEYAGEEWAESFEFAPIAPPADINGEVKEIYSRSLLRGQGWAISALNQNIVETIKYMDWWFSEQGKFAYRYGMEGTDYVKDENGKVTFTSLVMDSKNGVPMYMRENGQLEQGALMSMEAEMAGMAESAKEGLAMYESKIKIIPQFPTLSYTPDELAEINKITVELNIYIDETNAKWYAGSAALDDAAWEAYIAKCKELGSDKLIEVYQKAYDRLVENGGGVDDVTKNYTTSKN